MWPGNKRGSDERSYDGRTEQWSTDTMRDRYRQSDDERVDDDRSRERYDRERRPGRGDDMRYVNDRDDRGWRDGQYSSADVAPSDRSRDRSRGGLDGGYRSERDRDWRNSRGGERGGWMEEQGAFGPGWAAGQGADDESYGGRGGSARGGSNRYDSSRDSRGDSGSFFAGGSNSDRMRDGSRSGGAALRINGPSYAGKGPKGWQRTDERLRDEVNEALARHPGIDASEIEVRVEGGEVTLSGTVADRAHKRLAEEIAEEVFGIKEVQNHVRVQREGASLSGSSASGAQQTNDTSRGGEKDASKGADGADTKARRGATGGMGTVGPVS
jgi:HSP20 family molecular chaperone IbpA